MKTHTKIAIIGLLIVTALFTVGAVKSINYNKQTVKLVLGR